MKKWLEWKARCKGSFRGKGGSMEECARRVSNAYGNNDVYTKSLSYSFFPQGAIKPPWWHHKNIAIIVLAQVPILATLLLFLDLLCTLRSIPTPRQVPVHLFKIFFLNNLRIKIKLSIIYTEQI